MKVPFRRLQALGVGMAPLPQVIREPFSLHSPMLAIMFLLLIITIIIIHHNSRRPLSHAISSTIRAPITIEMYITPTIIPATPTKEYR